MIADPKAKAEVDELYAKYMWWLVEAHDKHKAANGFWDLPEFAAVREALAREGVSNAYYWSWYRRLVEEWEPLSDEADAAYRVVQRARRAWRTALRASAS